ncbi:MAG: C25 family cysteine peptidase [bacterium]
MKRLFLFLLLVACCTAAQGYWIPFGQNGNARQPTVEKLDMIGNDTVFTLRVPGVELMEKANDLDDFVLLEIPDNGWLMETGAPQVPAIRKNIIVPADASVDLKIDVIDAVQLKGYTVWPAQPSYKRSESPPPFQLDARIYNQDQLYPANWGRISQDAWMRDFRFVTVEINPVRVNPVSGDLIAATEIAITIATQGRENISLEPVFPSFYSTYKSYLMNFDHLNIGLRSDPEPMLMICHSSLMTYMSDFIDWKIKRGVDVHMVSSDVTGTSSSAILSYIQNVWNTWNPKPVFILLVGDAPQLQPLSGIGGCASDSKFTLLEGSDKIPDVLISRLSAQNANELNPQLNKILTYEMTPPDGYEAWLDKFAGLASSEGSSPSDEEYSRGIEARFLAHNPNATADRIYQSLGHGATQIRNAVNDGRFWLSYLGHGSGTSWSSPSFSNSDVDALTNGDFTPFIMDVSCSNGYFNGSSDCFAERWMKNSGKGAVSMFSSSTSCSWHEPAQMAWGVTYSVTGNSSGTIPGGNCILGQMTLDGILFMYDYFGIISATEEVMNQYVLFGDCSLMFRSDAYYAPTVTHLPNVPMISSELQVRVSDGRGGVEGAYVCAWKENEVHEVGRTGADGLAILNVAPTSVGEMLITVSGLNIYPQQSVVNVAPAGCGVIVMNKRYYNCADQITLAVYDSDLDVNPGQVETVIVEISSDSNPVPLEVLLFETGPDTAEFFGTIMTSSTQSGNGYLKVAHDDTILAYYYDEDCDGQPAEVTFTAQVDCQGPEISNVVVSAVSTDSFTVTWNTSEPATTGLIWGNSVPPVNTETKPKYVTAHSITLEDLDDCTLYYFALFAIDPSGNRTDDINSGSYYFAITKELVVFLDENMDTDPGWTYENLWQWGPASGQNGNPPSGHTGTHIVGYNLTGTYQNNLPATYMTTTSFDCTNASEVYLSFWRWLGVESSYWDHASIEISNNGGSTWSIVWEHTGTTLTENQWSFQEYDITNWAAGHNNVKLRWGMGPSDYMVSYCGWNIDDVLVSYVTDCTSVSTPTPAPTSTPTSSCIHNGDINDDGAISSTDAQMAFLIALGSYAPTYKEECAADCNGDGNVSASDAQTIFLVALGSETCADPL